MSGKFSPWAERFPEVVREVSHRPPFLTEKDGTEHSGIALLCPTKGPKFYLERAVGDVLSHRPSDGIELNRFYTSEAFQKKLLHGAETWQLATLNKHLFISSELPLFPGGHRASDDPTMFFEAFAANRMAANPDEWFNFLHKNRWYDLASSSTLDGSSDNETMSVDHPGVWDNLRGSIDLLDKILKALIVDRHNGFEGMLYGRISRWVDVAQYTPIRPPHDIALVLFTPEMERKIAIMEKGTPYRNELYGLTEEQRITAMAQRLTHLLQLHTWSFAPMDVGSGITKRAYPENNWSSLTVVSKEAVQELLGDDITLAERFIIQFDLTTTLLHEIMHAIISVRTNEAGIDYKLPEPLIDFDPIAEIGEAMEKRIFGGRYIMTPSLGVPLGTVLHEWPTLGTGGMINGKDPFWRKKAEDIKQPFPVLYISKLFSAEFWDNIYAPGKTATRFWQSTLFKNYQLDEANKRNWDGEERAVAEAYRATRYERDRYRDEALAKYQEAWRHTPWGVCNWEFLTSFTKNFKNDEYACYVACSQTRMCDWFSVERFITSMPRSDGLLSNWVPFSVGLLMYAAMPVRKSVYSIPNPRLRKAKKSIFKPSRECEILRRQEKPSLPESFKIEGVHWSDEDDQKRPRSVLFNPLLSDTDQVKATESVTQRDYLYFLSMILNYIRRRRSIISLVWYREIERCAKDLEAQRSAIVAAHPATHLSCWAKEWNFVPPEFSQTRFGPDLVRWNLQTQRFETVPQEAWAGAETPTTSAPPRAAPTISTAASSLPGAFPGEILPSPGVGAFPEETPQPPQATESKESCTTM